MLQAETRMEGVAQTCLCASLPPHIASPARVLCTRLRRSATSRGSHLEALSGVVESWLVGVERDDVGREEGEGCFPSKMSVSRRFKGSMTATIDCIAEF